MLFWISFGVVVYVLSVLFNILVAFPLWYRYSTGNEEVEPKAAFLGPLTFILMIVMIVCALCVLVKMVFDDFSFEDWYSNYLSKFKKKEK